MMMCIKECRCKHEGQRKREGKDRFGDTDLVSISFSTQKISAFETDSNSLNSHKHRTIRRPLTAIQSHTSLRENKFGTQHFNHLEFAGLHGNQARPVRCKNPPQSTKPRIRRDILHILRIQPCSFLLIAGWSSSYSPGAEKRNCHYQSQRSSRPTPKGNFD